MGRNDEIWKEIVGENETPLWVMMRFLSELKLEFCSVLAMISLRCSRRTFVACFEVHLTMIVYDFVLAYYTLNPPRKNYVDPALEHKFCLQSLCL